MEERQPGGTGSATAPRVVLAAVALSVLLGATFPFFVATLFETVPPVWPDEALFASAAADLIENGRLGTPLLAGVVPGIGEHTYWVPPLHLLYLAENRAIDQDTRPALTPRTKPPRCAPLAIEPKPST